MNLSSGAEMNSLKQVLFPSLLCSGIIPAFHPSLEIFYIDYHLSHEYLYIHQYPPQYQPSVLSSLYLCVSLPVFTI